MKSYLLSLQHCLAIVLLMVAAPLSSTAETVTLAPVADTSLFSSAPDNNVGGNLSIAVGNTAAETPIRGLIRFDTSAAIPSGARIVSVSLRFQVVRTPLGATPATFDLHRMLVGWGEGTGGAGGGLGTGSLANAGEATWISRFHGSLAWSTAGGAAGTDFASTASGSAANTTSEPMTFDSSDELVADVQAWVNTPAANFGWLIKDRAEVGGATARRLASREDTLRAPVLTVEFVKEGTLSVAAALDGSGNVCLHFTAKPGKTYKLQRRSLVDSGEWTTVSTRPADDIGGATTLCDPLNTSALSSFYRVSEE